MTSTVVERHLGDLSGSYENNEIEAYRMVQVGGESAAHHCAVANADRYSGRGHCCFEEKCVKVRAEDASEEGDVVDPRLASAFF